MRCWRKEERGETSASRESVARFFKVVDFGGRAVRAVFSVCSLVVDTRFLTMQQRFSEKVADFGE